MYTSFHSINVRFLGALNFAKVRIFLKSSHAPIDVIFPNTLILAKANKPRLHPIGVILPNTLNLAKPTKPHQHLIDVNFHNVLNLTKSNRPLQHLINVNSPHALNLAEGKSHHAFSARYSSINSTAVAMHCAQLQSGFPSAPLFNSLQ